MIFPIRTKLILTYLFLILVSLSILALAILWPLQNYYIQYVETELIKNARLVSRIIEQDLLAEDYQEIDKAVKELGEQINSRITVIKKNGEVLGETHKSLSLMENHADRPEFKTALAGKIGIATRFSTTLESNNLYVTLPIQEQGEVLAVIRLSLPILGIQETFALFRETLFIGCLLASLIALFLSLWLASTFTKPIEEISKTAGKIAQGDLEQKVFITSKDELALLSQSINEMTVALKSQINQVTTGKQRLEAVLSHMASGVLVVNSRGIIQTINAEAERMFGTEGKTQVGKAYQGILRNFGLQEIIEKVIKDRQIYFYEFTTIYPEKLTLRAHIAPVVQNNQLEQIVIVFHDITALKKLEKIKSDFVANASHELRTPVTAIKGFSETLLDGAMEEPELRERFIGIIDKEADRLIRLITDLLDLSSIEAIEKVEKQSVHIEEILESSILGLKNKARAEDINLVLHVQKGLPCFSANKDMLVQAFINLIDNGIKYTNPGGKVEVSASQDKKALLLTVKDNGMGIPKEDLPRVFERFYRVDKARTKEIGGTGLGLSIVKHIIEQHKGHIHVESEEGKGTIFYITLPL